MRTFYHDSKGDYREGNYMIFLECAIDNYLNILNIKNELDSILGIDDLWLIVNGEAILNPTIDTNKMSYLNKVKYKIVIQTIIMLSTFFEALINEIGMVGLGNKYYKDNLDTLSILIKWDVVLKLIYGENLNKNKKYFEKLSKLISTRNSLVHYKSKIANLNEIKPLDYYEIVLLESINILSDFFNDFDTINYQKKVISLVEIKKQLLRI